jgi:hypothetical protein
MLSQPTIISDMNLLDFFIGPKYKFSQTAVIIRVVELQQAEERRTPVYSLICKRPGIFDFVRQS